MNTAQRSVAQVILEIIAPALIMGMVGSFVLFLTTASYVGEFGTRLNVILGLFVFASVLIARISILEDHAYASFYGVALALVMLLAMSRMVVYSGPLAGFSLLISSGYLAVIWFFAHKLTWDCTFVDLTKDVTAKGIVDSIGSVASIA